MKRESLTIFEFIGIMTKSASSEFDRNRENQEENKRMSAVQRKSIVLYILPRTALRQLTGREGYAKYARFTTTTSQYYADEHPDHNFANSIEA